MHSFDFHFSILGGNFAWKFVFYSFFDTFAHVSHENHRKGVFPRFALHFFSNLSRCSWARVAHHAHLEIYASNRVEVSRKTEHRISTTQFSSGTAAQLREIRLHMRALSNVCEHISTCSKIRTFACIIYDCGAAHRSVLISALITFLTFFWVTMMTRSICRALSN